MTANEFPNNLLNLKLPPQLFFNGLQQVEAPTEPDGFGLEGFEVTGIMLL